MGFLSGVVMGLVVGVVIMAGWSRVMQRRTRKRVAKAADIMVLGSLGRDDLKKLCGDNFPEWISFPQYEQVKWLNKHLSKLWPFVSQAATAVVKESVEPLLDDYRPPGIKSLKFNKFSLGNVSPKIEGIRIQNLQPGQIIMDIDFRWGGDPSIILAVDARVASLPIQLKDLQVFTVVRVVFQLSEEIPCISAFVVALLAEAFIGDNLNPEWNETFELIVEDKETQSVIFEVYDEDNLQQDKRLGVAKLAVNNIVPEIPSEITLKLMQSLDSLKIKDYRDRGSLHLKVMYHPFTKEEQLEALESEKKAIEERKRLKEAGVIGSTMDALGGAASLVGSGVGFVGTGVAGGVGLVGSGLGAGAGLVGSGIGAVGSGLGKAGKFMGRTVTGHLGISRKSGSSSTVPQPDQPSA
ncbi:hypothetical protein ZWY2020_040657 [Hordeum vulgare]|nr:hypothetical protein ZWY2020_040657 [Hordeum vulgare]